MFVDHASGTTTDRPQLARLLERLRPGDTLVVTVAAVALGGDCLADVAVLREAPAVVGPVASDPAVSRLVALLVRDADGALAAISDARARVDPAAAHRRGPAHRRPPPRSPTPELTPGFSCPVIAWRTPHHPPGIGARATAEDLSHPDGALTHTRRHTPPDTHPR